MNCPNLPTVIMQRLQMFSSNFCHVSYVLDVLQLFECLNVNWQLLVTMLLKQYDNNHLRAQSRRDTGMRILRSLDRPM